MLRTFTSPAVYRITGVRDRVPLEFYEVNVQNRHIGSAHDAGVGSRTRARNPCDELYASIRSCALIYYPCNRAVRRPFPGSRAISPRCSGKEVVPRVRDDRGRGRGMMGRDAEWFSSRERNRKFIDRRVPGEIRAACCTNVTGTCSFSSSFFS